MPLYFFHVRGGSIEADEEEGVDLPDAAAVQAQAIRGARSIIAAEVLEGRLTLTDRIEVQDDAGRVVLTLPFSAAIEQS